MEGCPSPVRQTGAIPGKLVTEPLVLLSGSLFSQQEPAMSQHNDIRLTDILLAFSLLLLIVISVSGQVGGM